MHAHLRRSAAIDHFTGALEREGLGDLLVGGVAEKGALKLDRSGLAVAHHRKNGSFQGISHSCC